MGFNVGQCLRKVRIPCTPYNYSLYCQRYGVRYDRVKRVQEELVINEGEEKLHSHRVYSSAVASFFYRRCRCRCRCRHRPSPIVKSLFLNHCSYIQYLPAAVLILPCLVGYSVLCTPYGVL